MVEIVNIVLTPHDDFAINDISTGYILAGLALNIS